MSLRENNAKVGAMMNQQSVERAARLLAGAQRLVALTGAGFSRPSGIPDFRSDAGLWHRHDPSAVASLRGFSADPRQFFSWFLPLVDAILAAGPNPAHLALAELARQGKQVAIVTQNIDGLHQRAGSREVFELHGHIRSASCLRCGSQVPSAPLVPRVRRGEVPRCSCGGLLKPDVVLFDEMLPRGLYWLSERATRCCDAMIVAGTGLEVAPACELPVLALDHGIPLIVINQSPTFVDDRATVVLHEDVAAALPAIVQSMQPAAGHAELVAH